MVFVFKVDELEARQAKEDTGIAWQMAMGGGSDLHQVWLETEGEWIEGDTDDHELSLHYQRALTSFWNIQAGWRGDRGHGASRDWLLVGLSGNAPFDLDTEVRLLVGDRDRMAVELEVDKVFRLTPRWLLLADLRAVLHGRDDVATATGSGLTRLEAGWRLGFEVTPRLVPYAGVQWEKSYARTARYRRETGLRQEGGSLVLGVRFWL